MQKDKEIVQISANSGFWKKLWNLRILVKIKSLMLRAGTGCLPCKIHLQKKNVAVNDLCPICNNYVESIVYCLVTCSFAVACWNNIGINTRGPIQNSFGDWLLSMFDKCEK